MAWTCPRCDRSFGRREQPHSCVPVDDAAIWLARQREDVRLVGAALLDSLSDVEGWHAEGKRTALTWKRARTFAELQPRRAWCDLSLLLSRHVDSPRVLRTFDLSPTRREHVIRLHGIDDVDTELRGWLVEAFEQSPL